MSFSTGNFTLEGVFKNPSWGTAGQALFGGKTDKVGRIRLNTTGSNVQLEQYGIGVVLSSSVLPANNTDVFIQLIKNNNVMYLAFDGVVIASAAHTTIVNDANNLLLGNNYLNNYFNGYIKDFRATRAARPVATYNGPFLT